MLRPLMETIDRRRGIRRVRTPTVLQMEAVECGAAALAIVLGYFGRVVPLEELRVACGVSRDGSKASNVIKAARRYNLRAKGFKKEPADLHAMPLPLIVFWNFNHFLVVEGFGHDRVYLNDPASGPRVVSAEEFDHAFTGVTLSFEPNDEFTPGGRAPSLRSLVREQLRGSESALLYIILVSVALVLPGLAIPVFGRIFVDQVLVRGVTGWLVPLVIGMALTALLRAALSWLQYKYLLRLRTRLALTTASGFFWHIIRLPHTFFTQRHIGEIANRISLSEHVSTLLAGELTATVLNAITVTFYLALMLWYAPLLTLVGVLIALLNVLVLRAMARRRRDVYGRIQQERGKWEGTTVAGLQMIETVKAGGAEEELFARWAGYQAKVANAAEEMVRVSHISSAVPTTLNALNTTAILVLGGFQVMNEAMTVGMLVAFQTLMASFLAPFNQLVNLGNTVQELDADLKRLNDVLRHPLDPAVEERARATPAADQQATPDAVDPPVTDTPKEYNPQPPAMIRRLNGRLEFRNVTFGFSPLDPPLIENFNLVLEAGARVALVGGSGSGKSTLARLAAGLYQPWSGEILFDGMPREDWPRAVITNSLAMVSQEVVLFEGSVQENLTLWDPTVPQSAMIRAAKDACIHEDISSRAAGYEYRMAEGGRDWSGGQRQRLEIARALTSDPSILILDEATSALDTLTEQTIVERLRVRGCACLIVAHRLSTIRDADEIVVLDQGWVVQRGSHEELIQQPGQYADLIRAGEGEAGRRAAQEVAA